MNKQKISLWFPAAVVLMFASTVSAQTPVGSNLTLNPGFEATTNWSRGGKTWYVPTAYQGAQALRIGDTGGNVSQQIAVQAGARYRVTAYMSFPAGGETAFIGLRFFNSAGAIISQPRLNVSPPAAQAYGRRTIDLTVPAGTVRTRLYFGKTAGRTFVNFDEVRVFRLSAANPDWVPRSYSRYFISGHSLIDNPYPELIQDVAMKKGDSFMYNQQNTPGSPIRIRTKGDFSSPGWPGYSSGKNRDTGGMNIIEEFLNPQTLGSGERFNTLILTERHDILNTITWEDTIGFARHYHDRFMAGNPQGRSFLLHSWLSINKSAPSTWINHEKNALVAWECVASKVNHTLASNGRSDRMRTLPVGAALVNLVERALAGQVPGITGTTSQRLDRIFSDNVHLTTLGMYYSALVTYSSVNGKSAVGVSPPAGSNISPATATALQQIAWAYVNSYYNRPNPGARSMAQCRSFISQNVCGSFWTILNRPGEIQNCRNYFGDGNADAVFRWPDPNYVPWPAP